MCCFNLILPIQFVLWHLEVLGVGPTITELCLLWLNFHIPLTRFGVWVFLISRSKSSQRLISHDIHNNTYNYKSTFSVEIVPICKVHRDFLCLRKNVWALPPKLIVDLHITRSAFTAFRSINNKMWFHRAYSDMHIHAHSP